MNRKGFLLNIFILVIILTIVGCSDYNKGYITGSLDATNAVFIAIEKNNNKDNIEVNKIKILIYFALLKNMERIESNIKN